LDHVDASSINYEGDKVVVPGLQRLGSAIVNHADAIAVMNHTHFRNNKR